MAENVGAIYYDIEARTQGLVQGQRQMNKSSRAIESDFKRMEKSAGSFGSAMTKIASVVAGVFAIGAIKAKVQEQMKFLDNLAKTADALRIQQERLQALQYVADLTGAGADQLAVNLERMQRNLGRVAREGGPAEKALSDIGVSIKDVIDLSPDKQLEVLAKSITGIENAAVKASIAQDLFGRDGVRMLKLLEQLKNEGLDPAVRELEAMGVAISRVDSAKIEQANDSLTRAGMMGTAVFKQLAIEVAPIITGLAEAFVAAGKESGGFAQYAGTAIDYVVKAAGVLANSFRGWQMLIKLIQLGFLQLMQGATTAIATISKSLDGASDGTQIWGSRILQTLANVSAKAQNAVFGTTLGKKMQGVAGEAQIMSEVVADAIAELTAQLNAMAAEPLPDVKIQAFVQQWRDAAEKAGQEAAKASADQGSPFEFGLTDAQIKELESRVKTLGLTTLQALELQYSEEAKLLKQAHDEGIHSEEQYQQRLAELTRIYGEQRKAAIDAQNKLASDVRFIGVTQQQAELTRLADSYAMQQQMLQQALEQKLLTEQEYQEKRAMLEQQTQERIKAINEGATKSIKDQLDQLGFSLDTFQNQAIGSFAAVASGAMSGKDAIRGLAQSILTTAIGALIKLAITSATGQTAAVAQGTATAAALSTAYATPAALASLASFGANAAPASAGIAQTVALSQGLALGGGRLNGGPVRPGMIYPVTEDGRPEILMSGGKQYLLPGSRGEVVSNKDMGRAGGSNVTVNVINNASGTKIEEKRSQGPDGAQMIEIIVADIQQRGKVHNAITNTTTAGNRI